MPPRVGGVGVGTILRDAREARDSAGLEGLKAQAVASVDEACTRPPSSDEWQARVDSFHAREPDEDAALPELDYWDEAKTLPKQPGGCAGVAFGPSGVGKTTVLLADLLDAARDRGRRFFAVLAKAHTGSASRGCRRSATPATSRPATFGVSGGSSGARPICSIVRMSKR